MKVLTAKIKRDDDKYWEDTGLKVFIKDDGKVSIKDARTGEWYQCFEPRKREDDGGKPEGGGASPRYEEDFDSSIPF